MSAKKTQLIISGNPIDGIQVIGMFQDGEEASEWAEKWLNGEGWWLIQLASPKEFEAD